MALLYYAENGSYILYLDKLGVRSCDESMHCEDGNIMGWCLEQMLSPFEFEDK